MCIVCDMKAAGASPEVLAMAENLNMLAHSAMNIHKQLFEDGKATYTEGQRSQLKHIRDELRGSEIIATKTALEAAGLKVVILTADELVEELGSDTGAKNLGFAPVTPVVAVDIDELPPDGTTVH